LFIKNLKNNEIKLRTINKNRENNLISREPAKWKHYFEYSL